MSTKQNRLEVRIPDGLKVWLTDRAVRMGLAGKASPHNAQARLELENLKWLLVAEVARIRMPLAYLNALADLLQSTPPPPVTARALPDIYVECQEQLEATRGVDGRSLVAARWQIDENALLKQLKGLSPAADHALFDAIAQFVQAGYEPTVEGWSQVNVRAVRDPESHEVTHHG